MYGSKRIKSMIFTYDVLVALSLLTLFIFGLFIFYHNESGEVTLSYIKEQKSNYLSHDIISILEKYKFSNLPKTLKDEIINATSVEEEFLENKSTAEIIVLLWNKNQIKVIKNIIDTLLIPNKNNYNLNISIETLTDNFIVYSNTNKSSNNVAVSYTFITGYEESREPLGYVAKAFATKIKKTTTLVFPISPEGAGNEGGWLTITKKFYFPGYRENVTNAIFYISLHIGSDESDFETLNINGHNIKNDVVWIWRDTVSTGTGAFGYVNITNYIQHGWNILEMKFRNPWFNAHIHPGSRIEITYKDDGFYNQNRSVEKYVYYEDIYSQEQSNKNTGAWATMEYYVPLNAQIHNVTLHLALKDVDDVGWWWSWDDWKWYQWDVRVYVNGNLIDEINHPQSNMDLYYDLTPYTQTGTNYVVVYVNTYGNDFTGSNYTEIYSDPQNDSHGSTYIYLNYTYNQNSLYYGKIDITQSENLGGNRENPKTYSPSFNPNDNIISSFLHVAQQFSYTIDVNVWNDLTSPTLVFSSHFPRGIPSTIYIDPKYYNPTVNNYIKMEDECSGCDYLPESSFEYTILIPSHVGYGSVFPTLQEAVDDAINRLKNVLGSYVDATEIKNSTARIGNIPYQYGPVKLKVTTW